MLVTIRIIIVNEVYINNATTNNDNNDINGGYKSKINKIPLNE